MMNEDPHFIKAITSATVGLMSSLASLESVSELLTFIGAFVSICSGCLASYHLFLGIRIRKNQVRRENDDA